jgi:PadR family transcriptional regulator
VIGATRCTDTPEVARQAPWPRVLSTPHKGNKPDALQGTLDLLVLKTLSREPQDGYGVAARIQQITDDALRVEEGPLYPALHRMEQAGWDCRRMANHREELPSSDLSPHASWAQTAV